jgi:multicomponent Na+:H+ antiporter subunit B
MRGVILATATTYLMPVLLLFSLFLLLRGHNEPGGGFAGGLVAAAFVLLSISSGVAVARRALQVDPRTLVGLGLVVMLASGLVAPLLFGDPYLTSYWQKIPVGSYEVALGTPLLFDIGVYLGVAGTILLITFALEEEDA